MNHTKGELMIRHAIPYARARAACPASQFL